jgi:hypothetical protein
MSNKKFSLGLVITDELRLTNEEIKAQKSIQGHIRAGAPATWDWRNVGGKNYTMPIQDQGQCGSCVAFGSTATFETIKMVTDNAPQEHDIKRSEQDLFDKIGTCESGATLENANKVLREWGVCAERCYKYATDGPLPCCSQTKMKVLSVTRITSDTMAKDWLSKNGAIQAAFDVPESFFDYDGGVYKDDGSNIAGGHATCIIGYSEAKQAWLCKNSWGTEWGDPKDPGWFWIAYGNCNILRDYAAYGYTFTPPTPTALTVKITPKDPTVVEGQSIQLNGSIVGGKPPYRFAWDGDVKQLDNTNVLNPKFTAPIGLYSLSLAAIDATGVSAMDSTEITVTPTPPIKPDIVLKKAGTVSVNVMYVGTKAAKADLLINGNDMGQIKKGVLQLGKFNAGDKISFALRINEVIVQQNVVDDLSWAGVWFIRMSIVPGTTEIDTLLYVRETPAKTSGTIYEAYEIEEMLDDLITGAMLIGRGKQAILECINGLMTEGDE